MLSGNNPRPQVDPYWRANSDVVNIEAADSISTPLSLQSEPDAFIAQVIDTFRLVACAKRNDAWGSNDFKVVASMVSESVPAAYRKWSEPNRVTSFATPAAAADYVRSDKPSDLHRDIEKFLLSSGVNRVVFRRFSDVAHFHSGELAADAIKGVMPSTVSPTAFFLKYKHKVPRPHRVAGDILSGEILADARDIASLRTLTHGEAFESFTLRAGATPNHWSYPAMHATNAGAARLVAAACFDHRPGSAEDKAVCAAAAQNAFSRSVLGVHTVQDNLAGMALGQRIAFEALPAMLEAFADADPVAVRSRISDFMVEF